MANIKSAKKRILRTAIERERNRAKRSRLRSAVKRLRQAVADGDATGARELIPATFSVVDTTAQAKVIHRNAADRTKSRLERAVRKLEASAAG